VITPLFRILAIPASNLNLVNISTDSGFPFVQDYWWGNRRERDHWGDLGVDGWIILGWLSRRWDVGMWTGLDWPSQDRDRWRTLVSVVKNLRVP
jgi:hypothetical protein